MKSLSTHLVVRAVDLDYDPHLLLEDAEGRQVACYWPERGFLNSREILSFHLIAEVLNERR